MRADFNLLALISAFVLLRIWLQNHQIHIFFGFYDEKSAKSLCRFQKNCLYLSSTLAVLSLFGHLRRALKRQNAKTACAEPKAVKSVMVEPTEAGIS